MDYNKVISCLVKWSIQMHLMPFVRGSLILQDYPCKTLGQARASLCNSFNPLQNDFFFFLTGPNSNDLQPKNKLFLIWWDFSFIGWITLWFPAFSPFPKMFLKGWILHKVITIQNCLRKSYILSLKMWNRYFHLMWKEKKSSLELKSKCLY